MRRDFRTFAAASGMLITMLAAAPTFPLKNREGFSNFPILTAGEHVDLEDRRARPCSRRWESSTISYVQAGVSQTSLQSSSRLATGWSWNEDGTS